MKTSLIALITGAAAFCAGWFLKPAAPPAAPAKAVIAGSRAAAHPLNGNDSQKSSESAAAGSATAGAEPFLSVQEFLTLIEETLGEADSGSDELAAIEMVAAIPRLMATDAAGAKALLEALANEKGDAEVRAAAAGLLALRWMMASPEGATGYVLAHRDLFNPDGKSEMGSVFGDEALPMLGVALTARRNPAAARALMQLMPESDQVKEFNSMLAQFEARRDPAAYLTKASPEQLEALDDVSPVLARWAKTDPAAAAQWAQSQKLEDSDAWKAIAAKWAEKDQGAALQWAGSLEDPEAKSAAQSAIAEKVVKGLEPDAARKALAAFPGDLADRLMLENYYNVKDLPADAQAEVQQMLQRNAGNNEVETAGSNPAAAIVRSMTAGDSKPEAAAAWVVALPESSARSHAAGTLIGQWADSDAAAASAWVKALPAGDTRDHAAQSLVQQVRGDDPEAAIEWAKSISDEHMRQSELREVFSEWLPKEPQKAMSVLQQFPEDEQKQMLDD